MQSLVEQIKQRVDITEVVGGYVKLQKAGINLKARCPFHNERTPSFFVSPTRQSWRCFGCNKGGDIFSFIQEIEGLEFPEVLRILAQRAGVELKREPKASRDARQRLFDVNELVAKFFEAQLAKSPVGKRAQAYLAERGLTQESIVGFRLGWAPDSREALGSFLRSRGFSARDIEDAGLSVRGGRDRFHGRIMFPIVDGSNRVVGFTGRIFEREEGTSEPKYLNSPETPIFEKQRLLYGLHRARKAIRKAGAAVLVEGQMDCIMAHQAGTEHVVATSGTALTAHHITMLARLADTLVVAYDADAAGIQAAQRSVELALEGGIAVRLAIVPKGKDPADLIREDVSAWKELLAQGTEPIIAFLLRKTADNYDLTTAEGKRSAAKEILPMLGRIRNAVERSHWVSEVASRLETREEALWEELGKLRKPEASAKDEEADTPRRTLSRRELLEHHLLALGLAHRQPLPQEFSHDLFLSPAGRALHQAFMSVASEAADLPERLKRFQAAVADTYRSNAEHVAFTAEAVDEAVRDTAAEITACVREIRAFDLRDRLDALSAEMEAAERAGDQSRVRELAERFRDHSQDLSSLFV